MDEWLSILTAYLWIAVLGGIILGLGRLLGAGPGQWLPMQRNRRVSWNGLDVFLAFFVWLVVSTLAALGLRAALDAFDWLYEGPAGQASRQWEQFAAQVLATPFIIGAIILILKAARGTRLREIGITRRRAGADLAVGFVQWLLLTPLTLAIQFLALLATPEDLQAEHPIDKLIRGQPGIQEWVLLFVVAAAAAPLLEEFLLRGILLPWQLRGSWESQATVAFCAFLCAALLAYRGTDEPYNAAPPLFVLAMLPGVFLVPFMRHMRPSSKPETEATLPTSDFGLPTSDTDQALADMAIYANGLLFAAMHSSVWPTPVPLFLLGVGLAWARYRTSSLVAPVTVHALFNLTSMISLVLYQPR